MIRTALQPLSEIIELDAEGDVRSFVLREHSVIRSVEFLRKFDLLRQDISKVESLDLLEMSPAAWSTVAGGSDELLMWLLDRPEEGGKPADVDWLKRLALGQRQAILDAQAKLNRLEDIAPNLFAILRLLWIARMAAEMASDGVTNGSGGNSLINSALSMDATLTPSSSSGLSDSASSATDSAIETPGTV